jgi:hypothetical protein
VKVVNDDDAGCRQPSERQRGLLESQESLCFGVLIIEKGRTFVMRDNGHPWPERASALAIGAFAPEDGAGSKERVRERLYERRLPAARLRRDDRDAAHAALSRSPELVEPGKFAFATDEFGHARMLFRKRALSDARNQGQASSAIPETMDKT